MWKNKDYYEVSVEERLEFNHKIEEAYKKRGKYIEFVETPEPAMAFMQFNHLTDEISFGVGTGWWYEEENILPVIAMTHELGHYIDIHDNFNCNIYDYHRALGTLEIETRAWLYAVEVCKEIGFTRWEVFFRYAKQCLGTYFNAPCWQDVKFGFDGESPTYEDSIMRIEQKLPDFKKELVEEVVFSDPFAELMRKFEQQMEAKRQKNREERINDMSSKTGFEAWKEFKIEQRKKFKQCKRAKSWEL